MINEIVKMVATKANLSEPVAKIAVDTVVNMLKSKLPATAGTALTALLGSGTSSKSSGGLGDIAGTLGGLLGKKK